jgi:nitroreductase/NAD-dependent dihydropyrimidine dehydrogenase PreA subunit
MQKININADKCKKDGACVQVCPQRIFVQKETNTLPDVLNEDLCIACGHCVAICPHGAISHVDFPEGKVIAVHKETLPSFDQVLAMTRSRRSRRAFKDKPVERDLIEKVIEAARFAPSAENVQSTQYIVVQDKVVMGKIVDLTTDYLVKIAKQLKNPFIRRFLRMAAGRELEAAIESIAIFERVISEVRSGNDVILCGAPVLLLFYGDKAATFASVNANLALQNASFAAESLGLGNFYTGFVVATCDRDQRIQSILEIAKTHKIYAGLALGHPMYNYKNWMERRPAHITWI